jgi:phage RecT family recombinase
MNQGETPAVRAYQPPQTLQEAYSRMATTVAPLLPAGMDPKHFVGLVGSAMAKWNDEIRRGLNTPAGIGSFVLAAREAAELQLPPGTNAAALSYLVPLKEKGQWKVSFRVGYRGLEELAYRKGWTLLGRVVYKGDRFRVEYGTEPKIIHARRLSQPDTGAELVYAYAVCKVIATGRLIDIEVLNRAEVEKRRQAGNAPDGNWWKNHPARMWMKSPVRALGMRLPLAPSDQTLTQRGIAVIDEAESPAALVLPEASEMPPDSDEKSDDDEHQEAEGRRLAADSATTEDGEQGRLV